MSKPEREIPPGHTKPPMRPAPFPPDKSEWSWPDPRKLSRQAQLVLVFAALASVGFVLIDPEPLSGVAMVAVISVAAFAEARRGEASVEKVTLGSIYDRALGHAVWVAAAVWPITMLAIWLRNLIGLHEGVAS